MKHKEGPERGEQMLMPASVEDYIEADNPVRLIDAFVSKLDLKALGYKHAVAPKTGRPPYHPGDLLKLFIYGFMRKMTSTRPLEKETHRNLEVLWLLKGVTPDFKTIARFRRENAKAIEKTFELFVKIGVKRNFFGKALAAVDGTRFKGVNSIDRVYTKEQLDEATKRMKEKLQRYIKEVEEMDQQEENPEGFTAEEIKESIANIEEDLKELQEAQDTLEESGEERISLTDPDSRLMKVGSKTTVGYNAQFAVEAESKLIVAIKVTNDRADGNNLHDISSAAKQALETETLQVVADSAYHVAEEIKKCEDSGIIPFINSPAARSNDGRFTKDAFIYDAENDQYRCPAGETLSLSGNISKGYGRIVRAYKTTACRTCPLRSKCTKNKAGRVIERKPNEDLLDAMAKCVKQNPRLMRKRKGIIEHVFGCIKSAMGMRELLTKGFKMVRAELSLAALAFNLKRLINDRGAAELMKALA